MGEKGEKGEKGEIVVKRITQPGFGPAPGQIPSELKLPLMILII